MLLIFVVLFLPFSQARLFFENATSPANGTELVHILCNEQQYPDSDVVIILNHSIQYNITSTNKNCVISHPRYVTIKSDSIDAPVNIVCVGQIPRHPIPTLGIMFADMNITMIGVTITRCGARLSDFNQTNRINSTPPYYSDSHSGLFIFVNCCANFTNVTISNYYGFALLIIDSQMTILHKCLVRMSLGFELNSTSERIGSGVLIIYTSTSRNPKHRNIYISSSNFTQNLDYDVLKTSNIRFNEDKIINAAALTVILSNNTVEPVISIIKTQFIMNYGTYGSGLLMLMYNTIKGKVIIEQSDFRIIDIFQVLAHVPGGMLLSFYGSGGSQNENFIALPITITDTDITAMIGVKCKNKCVKYGVVSISVFNQATYDSFTFLFRKVRFELNHRTCLTARTYNSIQRVRIILESVVISQKIRNSFLPESGGIFAFNNIDTVIINGSSNSPSIFSHNKGSVIHADNSVVRVNGHVIFRDNLARQGAAFNMRNSILHFEKISH